MVFISGLPPSVDADGLRKDFANCGDIENVNVIRRSKQKQRPAMGFITFRSQEGLDAALKLDKAAYNGCKVQRAKTGEERKENNDTKSKKRKADESSSEGVEACLDANIANLEVADKVNAGEQKDKEIES